MSKVVKLKSGGRLDLTDRIGQAIRRCTPDSDKNGTLEVERTTRQVLSRIRYAVTTGIKPFDDIVGGFPFGRICEIYGLESCGKTALAIRTCVRAKNFNILQIDRAPDGTYIYTPVDPKKSVVEVLYMDNEQSLDEDEKLTVDGVKLDANVGRCDTVDQLFKMVDQAITTIEDYQEENGDLKVFLVVVIDTIASTASKEELVQDWGETDFPRHAKQLKQSFRKMIRDINRHNVCMICTNQVSDNFKSVTMGGRPKGLTPSPQDYVTFGGKALLFFSTHRIFMYSLATKYRLLPSAQFAAGFLIGFFSKKNRLRPPSREGRTVLLFDRVDGGLNNDFSVLETLIFLGYAELESKERGKDIRFKFFKHRIPLTTFDEKATETSLEEDDDVPKPKDAQAPRRKAKDPQITYRAEWPQFYQKHKADLDALYQAAVKYCFSTPGKEGLDAEALEENIDEET